MLSGNGPTERNAGLHDFPTGLFYARPLIGITGIKKNQWVQVAIAGMKYVAVGKVIFFGDLGHRGQCLRQFGSRHGTIVYQVIRSQSSHSAKGAASTLPEPVSLGRVLGFTDAATAIPHADVIDLLRLIPESDVGTFHLNDQHRSGISRIPTGITVLNRLDDGRIHHFQSGRYHSGGNDFRHRVGGIGDVIVYREHRNDGFGNGRIRKVISVTIHMVPSLPMITPRKS